MLWIYHIYDKNQNLSMQMWYNLLFYDMASPVRLEDPNWCQALFDLWSPKEWFTDYDVKICGNKPKVFFWLLLVVQKYMYYVIIAIKILFSN